MELRIYLKIILKNLPIILLFAIGGSLIAFLITAKTASGVQLAQLFYIAEPQGSSSASYRYEGYYAQERARNFTDTAVSILESPDFATLVKDSPGSIQVRKMAPQVIRVTASATSETQTASLINAAAGAFNQKMAPLSPAEPLTLKAIGNGPQAVFSGPTRSVSMASGFLLGTLFALLVVGIRTYLKV